MWKSVRNIWRKREKHFLDVGTWNEDVESLHLKCELKDPPMGKSLIGKDKEKIGKKH